MTAMAAIVHIIYKLAKLKALVTGIAFQPIKGREEIFDSINNSGTVLAKHNGTW